MTTLQIQNIKWNIFSHEGKTAFQHNQHSIVYSFNNYFIFHNGKPVFSGTRTECLTASNHIVLDFYANQLTPSWESK